MYNVGIDREPFNPETIAARLQAAEERKADALAAYEEAGAEVTWLKEGLRLFDPAWVPDDNEPEESTTELFPDAEFFADHDMEPTLRQAIVVVMREQPGRHWTVTELASALAQKGWLPEKGAKRVSDMAGDMVRLRQLRRPKRGVYVLSPEIAAALEAAPEGSRE